MGEDSFFSGFQELDTPPITLRPDGEVHPVAPVPVALDEEFIEVLLPVISRIEQYCCITDGLLNACTTDIHGTTRKMVARIRATHALVHLRRSIPARNNDRLLGIFLPSSVRRGARMGGVV